MYTHCQHISRVGLVPVHARFLSDICIPFSDTPIHGRRRPTGRSRHRNVGVGKESPWGQSRRRQQPVANSVPNTQPLIRPSASFGLVGTSSAASQLDFVRLRLTRLVVNGVESLLLAQGHRKPGANELRSPGMVKTEGTLNRHDPIRVQGARGAAWGRAWDGLRACCRLSPEARSGSRPG